MATTQLQLNNVLGGSFGRGCTKYELLHRKPCFTKAICYGCMHCMLRTYAARCISCTINWFTIYNKMTQHLHSICRLLNMCATWYIVYVLGSLVGIHCTSSSWGWRTQLFKGYLARKLNSQDHMNLHLARLQMMLGGSTTAVWTNLPHDLACDAC